MLAMFNFLQYATTAQVARATGAGQDLVARRLGAQAFWLSLAIGVTLAVAVAALAGPIVTAVGVEGRTADLAETYLRIVAIGVPSFFLALSAALTVALVALADVLPRIFSGDAEVLAQCALLWPIFAVMQPLNGAVFALDGILIGASDGPYIAGSMVAAFLVCAVMLTVAVVEDWGVRGVWAALAALIVVRAATMGARFARRRWLVTGWA